MEHKKQDSNFDQSIVAVNKGFKLGQAQPRLGLGLNKFDFNNGNGGFGEGLNIS